jgi:hypothetical protein
MRARSKLKPGQPGTQKLVKQYGRQLVCVRYRYDAIRRKRYTTAEIIVGEAEWDPLPSAVARRELVWIRVGIEEIKLREKVKACGGRWDAEKRLWKLPMEQVLRLGLTARLTKPASREVAL